MGSPEETPPGAWEVYELVPSQRWNKTGVGIIVREAYNSQEPVLIVDGLGERILEAVRRNRIRLYPDLAAWKHEHGEA